MLPDSRSKTQREDGLLGLLDGEVDLCWISHKTLDKMRCRVLYSRLFGSLFCPLLLCAQISLFNDESRVCLLLCLLVWCAKGLSHSLYSTIQYGSGI